MDNLQHLLTRITISPTICHGKPVIRNKRYPVESILQYLAGGDTIKVLLKEFADLEKDDILACIAFATIMIQNKSIKVSADEIHS
ncbi:MAG: hypothetical protein COS14_03290 [Bacteroidetes bacterium CG02_land_8_20_14_3_00_31_25]|nr:MAG: hypothetical protein COS14_03290 [Bacteroidetes bacterium CG02_land_8_20_14_3_00_31_25]PIX35904.1 MAG: hypothetical protein COZ59_03950 [Bacteroidetes bacterium CG_4_8_14_3_um_filter_31_14]PIY02947.1 MAG: hypothetical protein COZ21_11505 [Bacteroidetes bacterium CG_4_10_14_3_um_filter_31_20]